MMARLVRSVPEVLAAIRARQNELDITNANIEALVGLPDRYLSKLISARPIKGLSAATLRNILDGLALGIVAVVIDEDPEQAKRMRPRWVKRKRPPTTPTTPTASGASGASGASLSTANQRTLNFEDDERI
jgi:hypothetical protein